MELALEQQRKFFQTQKTKSYEFRMKALERLESRIRFYEKEISEALYADLRKSETEAYMAEIGMTLSELAYTKKHLKQWMRLQMVKTPLAQFPSRSFTMSEPYGCVLIMAPWNYPFMLTMEPLIGAIASGNCVVVKPSAYAAKTSDIIKKIIEDIFPPKYVQVVLGGREENEILLNQKFDYIFFTGSKTVGKLVMEKASAHLTPVTLELGGKSPCIIDKSANLELAAKRLVFGKFFNSGQTCVAPDYVLVHKDVEVAFLFYIRKWIVCMYGENPLTNEEYPKIINQKHYQRLMKLIKESHVLFGGKGNPASLRIEPTIVTKVDCHTQLMEDEIFGPILPVIPYENFEELRDVIDNIAKPLAFYLFAEDKQIQKKYMNYFSFGGGCINDTIIHLATSYMGFGGVGESGMGTYHGVESFRTFSHKKSVVMKESWLDIPLRYHPYDEWKLKMIKMFMK